MTKPQVRETELVFLKVRHAAEKMTEAMLRAHAEQRRAFELFNAQVRLARKNAR